MYGSPPVAGGLIGGGTLASTGFPVAGFTLLALSLIIAGALAIRAKVLLDRKPRGPVHRATYQPTR